MVGFTAENLCPRPLAVSTDDVAGQTSDVSTDIPYSTVRSELQTSDQQELTSLLIRVFSSSGQVGASNKLLLGKKRKLKLKKQKPSDAKNRLSILLRY